MPRDDDLAARIQIVRDGSGQALVASIFDSLLQRIEALEQDSLGLQDRVYTLENPGSSDKEWELERYKC